MAVCGVVPVSSIVPVAAIVQVVAIVLVADIVPVFSGWPYTGTIERDHSCISSPSKME